METAISDPAVAWFLSKAAILVAIILIVSGPYLLYAVLAAINWWHCRTDRGSEKEKDSEGSPNGMASVLKTDGGDAMRVRISHPPPGGAMEGIDTDIEQLLSDIEEAQDLHIDMSGAGEALEELQSYVEEMIRHRDQHIPFTEGEVERIGEIRREIRGLLGALKEIEDEQEPEEGQDP